MNIDWGQLLEGGLIGLIVGFGASMWGYSQGRKAGRRQARAEAERQNTAPWAPEGEGN